MPVSVAQAAYLSSGNLVKNPALLNIPLVISAQQVDYNLPGLGAGGDVKLSGPVLARMYSGTITAWNDPAIAALNPGVRLPAIKVVPVYRSDSSGDTFLFSSYGTTVAWPPVRGAPARRGNSGVVAGCEAVPGCVAYVGISYLSQALAGGLGEAELANAAGRFVLPTAATISASVASFVSSTPPNETISMVDGPAAHGYPIVNYEYAIVSARQSDPDRARAVRAFLTWLITTGNSAPYLNPVDSSRCPRRWSPSPASRSRGSADGQALLGRHDAGQAMDARRRPGAADLARLKNAGEAQTEYALGYRLTGGSFMQVASEEAHLVLLPAARAIYANQDAALTAASSQATGLPLVIAAGVLAVITGFALYRTQRWLVITFAVARSDLVRRGSTRCGQLVCGERASLPP